VQKEFDAKTSQNSKKKMLLEITEKDRIIENKQTDGVTTAKKNTWHGKKLPRI
jgi:hypothetical protein